MLRRFLLLAAICALPVAAQAQDQVSWDTFARVKLVKEDARFIPKFEDVVKRLDGQRVKVQGFMLPLDQEPQQAHFILSANPTANCFFCMPGGPESLIEVKSGSSVAFSYDPITVTGKLELLQDDPMGMYYRIVDARVEG